MTSHPMSTVSCHGANHDDDERGHDADRDGRDMHPRTVPTGG